MLQILSTLLWRGVLRFRLLSSLVGVSHLGWPILFVGGSCVFTTSPEKRRLPTGHEGKF